ncbi:MAG: efflux transporter outer membrane subunit [Limisphaerales bacterium]
MKPLLDICLALFIGASAAVFCGCAVGPDFKKPAAPKVSQYTAQPLTNTPATAKVAGGASQRFVNDLDIPGQWWTLFHSQPLNDLIERALKANPDLRAAQAALAVAHENVRAQQGAYYPSANASFSASRNKTPALLSPNTASGALYYSLYTPQVEVSYTPDVFGLNRRTLESLRAQSEQQRFALAATFITLSANVVSAAVQEASLRAQIEATRELIAINTRMIGILRAQFSKGYASRLEVAAQETQLAQVNALLPALEKQLAQQRDALAVLSGVYPSEGFAETFYLTNLTLPENLPSSLPSRLVEQRPDIRQAEENLHAASAQVGMAIANRLPNLTLTANAGSSALSIGQLLTSGTGFWGLGADATQPIFQGGTLLHRERAAKAAYTEAAEQYRGAVLTAFQNVADTLTALEQDAATLKADAEAEQSARATLNLTEAQAKSGYVNYLALLNAEQMYQQAEIALIQAQAGRFSDTAALFLALGGGWWNRADFPTK